MNNVSLLFLFQDDTDDTDDDDGSPTKRRKTGKGGPNPSSGPGITMISGPNDAMGKGIVELMADEKIRALLNRMDVSDLVAVQLPIKYKPL